MPVKKGEAKSIKAKSMVSPDDLVAVGQTARRRDQASPTFGSLSIEARHAFALRYAGFATWAWDVQSDAVIADAGFRHLFGMRPAAELSAASITDQIVVEDRPKVAAALRRTVSTGEPYEERFRVGEADDIRWLRGIGEVYEHHQDGTAAIVIGLNMDITEVVEAEERLVAVIGEMRHRIKNSLAMVSSLAAATARDSDAIDEFVEKFRGRIDALAAAQRAIGATSDTQLLDLEVAITEAMAPLMETADWKRRISIDVGQTDVPPSLGQAIALTIYELATNAIKYGALLYEEGTIDLTCTVPEHELVIEWVERHLGDEILVRSAGSGFGTRLIDRLITAENGSIKRTHVDGGYRVRLTFPLAAL